MNTETSFYESGQVGFLKQRSNEQNYSDLPKKKLISHSC